MSNKIEVKILRATTYAIMYKIGRAISTRKVQERKEKSTILLYTKVISYFGCSNIIFLDYIIELKKHRIISEKVFRSEEHT